MRKATRALGFDALEGRVVLSGATITYYPDAVNPIAVIITTPNGNAMAHFLNNGSPQDVGGARLFYSTDASGQTVQTVLTPSGNYNNSIRP